VEGIGPLKAVSSLIFPVAIISQAIENEDLTVLNQMPGIGARAAQKMIATLKGKLMEIIGEAQSIDPAGSKDLKIRDQALEILKGLGFKESDAIIKMNEVVSERPELSENLEELIREIFKANVV
jgi:Holliday junction DNA helicase RuvA